MVDLKGFEPLTSSMPFKKYQSLAGRNDGNTRLSVSRRGRRWTPRASFLAFGLHADSGTPPRWTGTRRAFTRAVAGCGDCCLLEQTTTDFSIRMMPKRSGEIDSGCGMYQACPSENRNRTLYLRRMRLGTILAADFALASKFEATRIPRTFPLSSSAATSPM